MITAYYFNVIFNIEYSRVDTYIENLIFHFKENLQ